MSLKKLLFAVAVVVFVAVGSVFAQEAAEEVGGAEDAVVSEEAQEEAPAPAVVSKPVVAPVSEAAPAPAAAAVVKPAAAKPELKVDFYGSASYRFRGRLWSVTDAAKKSGGSFDYLNLLGWMVGLKAKVDDQLSLQFQIGNDLNAGESVTWANNKTPAGRTNAAAAFDTTKKTVTLSNGYNKDADNIYVHLAYATWNPGPIYLSGGVIPVVSNGTLDLLERSLNTGSYGEAIFQGWATQTNNSLIAIKLGVPILKDEVKVSAELTSSVIDPRVQGLGYTSGTTGAVNRDVGNVTEEPKANPTSALFILDVPIAAGDLKVTPELTAVLNRNYNATIEEGDHEILVGLSAGYKVNDAVSLSLNGGYGFIGNTNSQVGEYGSTTRSGSAAKLGDSAFATKKYNSNGIVAGIGTTIKAGPGAVALNLNYNNSVNITDYIDVANNNDYVDVEAQTNKNDILVDLRYTWNVHSKFSIAPRWRLYVSTYDEKSAHVKSKMENRPEIILTGSF